MPSEKRFLRHRNFELYVEEVDGDPGLKDATFRIVAPFVAETSPPLH